MPESPSTAEGGIVSVTVTSNGTRIADTIQLLSITMRRAVNAIATAQLVFDDSYIARQDFPLSNQDVFMPGAEISIRAGWSSMRTSTQELNCRR